MDEINPTNSQEQDDSSKPESIKPPAPSSTNTNFETQANTPNNGTAWLPLFGLLTGLAAIVGLMYIFPVLKNEIDSLRIDVKRVSLTVSAYDKKIDDVGGAVGNLNDRVGKFENNLAVMELRKVLSSLENLPDGLNSDMFKKTELARKNIRSILSDIDARAHKAPPAEEPAQTGQEVQEETAVEPAPPAEEPAQTGQEVQEEGKDFGKIQLQREGDE